MHDAGAVCKHAQAAINSLRDLAASNTGEDIPHSRRVLARAVLYLVDDIYAHLQQIEEGLPHRPL